MRFKSAFLTMLWLTMSSFFLTAQAQDLNGSRKDPREVHLRNIQQLTNGGENAEAYFSLDGQKIIFQATPRDPAQPCDQIFMMNLDGSAKKLMSTGTGRTTCSFILPDNQHVIYASTHQGGASCPPPADMSKGYTWALYADYEIYLGDVDGKVIKNLTNSPGYDAEAVISPRGDRIVFTSVRSGDLELWLMDLDGSNLKQLTNTPGYDGGAFFSPDGSQIVWRASRFDGDAAGLADYQNLLKQGQIRPSKLDIYVMNADGSRPQRVTNFNKASFAPYFHPSGQKIIFSSNLGDPKGREFDIYMVNLDGSGLERITYTPGFDGFPMFSPDGQKLIFCSNRRNERPNETNVFICDWVDDVRRIVPELPFVKTNPANDLPASVPQKPAQGSPVRDIAAADVFRHIRYLADDRLAGRFPGSDGIEYAARYIADRFAGAGLQPVGDDHSYYQTFEFPGEVKLGKNNRLAVSQNSQLRELKLETDFMPIAFSALDTVEAEVVFAGYGISAPDDQYDDYAGLDVTGKIVLLLRSSPRTDTTAANSDPHDPHAVQDALVRYAALRHKLVTARQKGAAGVLFVTGPAQKDELEDIVKFRTDYEFKDSGIAAAGISRTVAESLLKASGKTLTEAQAAIDSKRQPASFALAGIKLTLQTDVQTIKVNVRNVVGFLPGQTDEVVVIGAHYDHLGLGGPSSLDARSDVFHNGADDNASGTAGLLELAAYFGQNLANIINKTSAQKPSQGSALRHGLLFIAFTAEELGLIGSKYYVENPLLPLNKTVAMINMDMIGRMKDSKLIVNGTGTSPVWPDLIKSVNATYKFDLAMKEDGPAPSDQTSFYRKDVPVLFFFTGAHEQYHKSTDDFWRINYEGEANVIRFVRDTVTELDGLKARPAFTKAESQDAMQTRSSFKVTLGVVPDYAYSGKGLHLDVVREGRPAYKAGLQSGDVIIKLGEIVINGIYDYMSALNTQKPGNAVDIVFTRDGKEMTAKVIFE